jgi:hypothetical protein
MLILNHMSEFGGLGRSVHIVGKEERRPDPGRHSRHGPWIDTQVNLWDAGLIRRFADMPEVTVIRIADLLVRSDRISSIDHFHPGSLGYAAIARRIADTF